MPLVAACPTLELSFRRVADLSVAPEIIYDRSLLKKVLAGFLYFLLLREEFIIFFFIGLRLQSFL